MDMQKLVNLICLATDNSALSLPPLKDILALVKGWDGAEHFYASKDVSDCIDNLRNSCYATVSERRSMTVLLLKAIVAVHCETQGLDIVYRLRNTETTLNIGLVSRETYTGVEQVYGIRDCHPNNDVEPTWEYLPINHFRLFEAIAWREVMTQRRSVYGWHDPININKPMEM